MTATQAMVASASAHPLNCLVHPTGSANMRFIAREDFNMLANAASSRSLPHTGGPLRDRNIAAIVHPTLISMLADKNKRQAPAAPKKTGSALEPITTPIPRHSRVLLRLDAFSQLRERW